MDAFDKHINISYFLKSHPVGAAVYLLKGVARDLG